MRKPDFARVRKTLLLQGEADYVPLFDSVDRQIKSALLGHPVTTVKDEVEFCVTAGYDFVHFEIGLRPLWRNRAIAAAGGAANPVLKVERAQYSVINDVANERAWANESTKGVVTNDKEFEEFGWPTVADFDFSVLTEAKKYMPAGMKTLVTVDGIFTPVWLLAGGEFFYRALIQNPVFIKKMFDRVGDMQYKLIEKILSYDSVGALRSNDDIAYNSGTLVSPKHLRQYAFPWLKRVGDLCKQKDIPLVFHSDGNLMAVLDDLVAAGVKGVHPIQPNAMDIIEVKKKYGDKLCLLGNIDMDVMTRGTEKDVEALVIKNLHNIAPGGGYLVGASNSVPEFIPLKNYNAMRETALKFGKYPISV
jgi:uroporphyrinogen decarboxylase